MLLIENNLLPIKVNISHLFEFKKKKHYRYVIRSKIVVQIIYDVGSYYKRLKFENRLRKSINLCNFILL